MHATLSSSCHFAINNYGVFAKVLSMNLAVTLELCTYQCQARGGGGGGGSDNPREFDCDMCPQGGDFDHLILQLQRAEEK